MGQENQPEAETEPSGVVIVVVSTLAVAPCTGGRQTGRVSGERGRKPHMQAAHTESVVDGVEPRGTLPVPLRMPSLPFVPSRAPNLLLPPTGAMLLARPIGTDAPLRPFLRRGFDGVVQSGMPCARASGGCVNS